MRQELAVLVETYLNSQNWKFNYNSTKGLFTFNMSAKNFTGVRVVVQINDDSIIAYAMSPINVPEEKRQAASEFIVRANYGMKVGTLELDMSDGEIRNRTYIIAKDALPNLADVEKCVDFSFLVLDRYGKGLLPMIYGNLTPEAAVNLAES
ncbi:MAG: hypothetical protein ACLSX2_05750 [Christensenellaceae bacterium]